jgi:RHS repeat-associated protein
MCCAEKFDCRNDNVPSSSEWNFFNQLCECDTRVSVGSWEVTFEYDALGRRVSRSYSSGNVVYVYAGQQVIADYARGAVTSSPTYRYVYAECLGYAGYVDEPILRHTGTTTTLPTTGDNALYYHRNQQYSIVGLTNAAGTLVERYTYSAYGTLGIYAANGTVRSSSTYANRYTYTGREYDPDLNLYHFRARWYDPATGGFISRDPLGYVDGMSLYRGYFGVQELDPFGLWRSDDDWLWPWDSRASWDPETTIGTWVAGGEYACSGAANFILTGDSEASEEILNAATEGWIKGFGLNPFDTTQSLGQLVYTDQLSTSTEIIQAAIARSHLFKNTP